MVRRSKIRVSLARRKPEKNGDVAVESDDKAPAVGDIIDLVGTAFEEKANEVVKNIARMAAPPGPGESDPTRETILSYAKPATWIMVKGKSVRRRNRETPMHHKFAHLVINYLEGRRRGAERIEHIAVPDEVRDSEPWQTARKLCKRVLDNERDRRFERPLGSDPGMQSSGSRASMRFAAAKAVTACIIRNCSFFVTAALRRFHDAIARW
jgi:hypothetical protein